MVEQLVVELAEKKVSWKVDSLEILLEND